MKIICPTLPYFNLGDELYPYLKKFFDLHFTDESVVCVSLKLLSLSQKRLAPKEDWLQDKKKFLQSYGAKIIGQSPYGGWLTDNNGLIQINAGLDQSNCPHEESVILYPDNIGQAADEIYRKIREDFPGRKFGFIFCDSLSRCFRKGSTGIAVTHVGLSGLKRYEGQPDLNNRPLELTEQNQADALASAATLCMGEGNECKPIALIRHAPIEFCEVGQESKLNIAVSDDLYISALKK